MGIVRSRNPDQRGVGQHALPVSLGLGWLVGIAQQTIFLWGEAREGLLRHNAAQAIL